MQPHYHPSPILSPFSYHHTSPLRSSAHSPRHSFVVYHSFLADSLHYYSPLLPPANPAADSHPDSQDSRSTGSDSIFSSASFFPYSRASFIPSIEERMHSRLYHSSPPRSPMPHSSPASPAPFDAGRKLFSRSRPRRRLLHSDYIACSADSDCSCLVRPS